VQQRSEGFRHCAPFVCSGRAKVKVLVRLDGGSLVSNLKGMPDHEQIEFLEIFDVDVVPGVGTFADIRNFFPAQGSPIICV
jgi:hypothetical protein